MACRKIKRDSNPLIAKHCVLHIASKLGNNASQTLILRHVELGHIPPNTLPEKFTH
jgi:hypothetical protein